jgi:UDP-N-acetylglucosamine 2-epimerase (non-hydrolysing)
MKVMTVFGTRPELIRLSLVLKILDQHCEHTTVHTGQNFDASLSDIFLRELDIREPDVHLGIREETFGEQAGQIIARIDQILSEVVPDRLLILGDTNSGLAALPAARRGIPVFHMEAGNRCFDGRVPEEVNRRIIDHSSTVLMPYTERSCQNLLREGIERERIFVTGNPIKEVLDHFTERIDASDVVDRLGLQAYGFLLATLHRAENVDDPHRLASAFRGLMQVSERFSKPVIVSVHPRTSAKLKSIDIGLSRSGVRLIEPLGLFDFVKLEKNALAVLTDSGTVQEECCIFRVPNVTLRDVTERPETVECGSNILAGVDSRRIADALEVALAQPASWLPPPEYLAENVSQAVSRIVLGHTSIRRHV